MYGPRQRSGETPLYIFSNPSSRPVHRARSIDWKRQNALITLTHGEKGASLAANIHRRRGGHSVLGFMTPQFDSRALPSQDGART